MENVSGSGVGDSIVISAPGWEDNSRADVIGKLPPCPSCGVKLSPHGKWKIAKLIPPAVCSNESCTANGRIINSRQWKEM